MSEEVKSDEEGRGSEGVKSDKEGRGSEEVKSDEGRGSEEVESEEEDRGSEEVKSEEARKSEGVKSDEEGRGSEGVKSDKEGRGSEEVKSDEGRGSEEVESEEEDRGSEEVKSEEGRRSEGVKSDEEGRGSEEVKSDEGRGSEEVKSEEEDRGSEEVKSEERRKSGVKSDEEGRGSEGVKSDEEGRGSEGVKSDAEGRGSEEPTQHTERESHGEYRSVEECETRGEEDRTPDTEKQDVDEKAGMKGMAKKESRAEDVWRSEGGDLEETSGEIEYAVGQKPFIGGYRDTRTGTEYHNASTQCLQRCTPPKAAERFSRDTQTLAEKHQSQQTANTTSTQTPRVGYFIINTTQVQIFPKKYITADEIDARREEAVVILQKHLRARLDRILVNHLKRMCLENGQWHIQMEKRKQQNKEERRKWEIDHCMNPKSKEDFEFLFYSLEKWCHEELAIINALKQGDERKAALCRLLEHQTQMLASIDYYKKIAVQENRKKAAHHFLHKCARTKQWLSPRGAVREMDTPLTVHARGLRDIYSSITNAGLSREKRVEALVNLKSRIKNHNSKMAQEIGDLADREVDLMTRGMKEACLEGLRQRISTLFLKYCKTPMFNPEAARLLRVPQDPGTLQKNVNFCVCCQSYLPSAAFAPAALTKTISHCRSCTALDNSGRKRKEMSLFRTMLLKLRTTEQASGDNSSCLAFLIGEEDFRYLVEVIWSGQSAHGGSRDLVELVMVRWDKNIPWNPWNCILLTEDEARLHLHLKDRTQAYKDHFLAAVHHRHVLARFYFSSIDTMAKHIDLMSAKPQGQTVRATKT
uniref:IQ motif and ubiquitin-like domain-containing protein n=1 Tax=Myxine glutinosa TaxID=7769 RepID=UPI00358F35ED